MPLNGSANHLSSTTTTHRDCWGCRESDTLNSSKACVQGYSDLFPPFFHSLLFFLALELSQHVVTVSQLASSKSIVFPLCYEAVDFV